jgi:hypothetical protein
MYTEPGLYRMSSTTIFFVKKSGSKLWFSSTDGVYQDKSTDTTSILATHHFNFLAPCSSMRQARELFPEYFI